MQGQQDEFCWGEEKIGTLEKANLIQEIAEEVMKGKKPSQIAAEKQISVPTVRAYLSEWEEYVKTTSIQDPELFDRVLENSLKFIENYDLMLKNAWEVHDEARDNAVSASRLQALKVIQEVTAQKARFYQLLGPRQDNNFMEKAKRAERVNELLSNIIRDVVSDCEHCRPMVWDNLQQAFSMIGKEEPRALP